MKRIILIIAAAAAVVALAAPSAALAASSTCQAYNTQLSQLCDTPSTQSSLPFTGLDVGLLAIGGGALLGAGVVIRQLSRRLD